MSGDVTRVLCGLPEDSAAAEELLPLVYDELRRLAARRLAGEDPGQTLQPTALVHEAWLHLLGPEGESRSWRGREHFYAAAAEAMRRILVGRARRRHRLKRGGGKKPLDLAVLELPVEADDEKILLVSEALEEFSRLDPRRAEVVKLRYFVGLNHAEIASLLGVSEKTVIRHWSYAKAWLLDAIDRLRAGPT